MITLDSNCFVLIAFVFGIAIHDGNLKYVLVYLGDNSGARVDIGKS